MTATTNVATKTRWIDTGKPQLIPAAAPIRALQTSVCQDLQSECTRLHLELRRIHPDGDGAFHAPVTGGTQLWFDTTTGLLYGPKAGGTWPAGVQLGLPSGSGQVYVISGAFTFDGGAEQNIGPVLPASARISSTQVQVITPYNDVLAELSVGFSGGDAEAVMKSAEINAQQADTYMAPRIVSAGGQQVTLFNTPAASVAGR